MKKEIISVISWIFAWILLLTSIYLGDISLAVNILVVLDINSMLSSLFEIVMTIIVLNFFKFLKEKP